MPWQQTSRERWRRHDGAEVWRSADHYHSNPLDPRCRLWEGAGPGPDDYLMKAMRTDRRERFRTRRRFGGAQAAMRAVDRAYPPTPEAEARP